MARARLSRRPPTSGRSWPRRLVGPAIVALAIGAAVVPTDPHAIERTFSRGWYPALQPLVTSASSLAPFALLDVWLLGAVALVARAGWRVVRGPAGTRWRAAGGALWRGVVAAAALYLLFLVFWGFNYRRAPITSALSFDASRVTAKAVDELAIRAVRALNGMHAPAHAELATSSTTSAVRARLAPAFADAQRALGHTHLATPGRPKASMLSPYFRWASIDGMVNPFGLEVIVNPDVLPVELPFVVAHEWGHLAGWAPESEASYLAWVTCLGGDRSAQYSAWLSLYWHLRRAVPRERLRSIERELAEGPRRDLRAIAARLARGRPLVQQASWQTYDQFLKANRVESGIASYDEVLRLVIGIAADDAGRPLRAGAERSTP